jgi:glycerate kinase
LGASLCIVGEGSLDEQSLRGKAPLGAAALATAAGVPVIAVAGRITVPATDLAAHGIPHAYALLDLAAGDLTTAMTRTPELLHRIGVEIAQRRS